MFSKNLTIAGEHRFNVEGAAGLLEGILLVPEGFDSRQVNQVAMLGHPHSLYGGTMQNKVITTMAKTFQKNNIPSIRFNFRGVGQSEGAYDAGLGESEDMLLLTRLWLNEWPESGIIYAGFSFGSYVAYRAASQQKHSLLLSVAPAVHHYDYQAVTPRPHPWYIIQGEKDEVVSFEQVFKFATEAKPPIPLIRMPEASHFFHGKLLELASHIQQLLGGFTHGSNEGL